MPDPLLRRILIVEDELAIAIDLKRIVAELGYEVAGMAGTLSRALQQLEDPGAVDAVLLDANLHGESALPVAERLKELRIPFAITSGYEAEELRHSGFPRPHVAKPYGAEAIGSALRQLEGRR
ncbi:response regulator [Oceaniglobus roseus]|uniref:response regulator n=1 Tax=Oceaniglobus roseus TaxID=1737570 RepID=UPI000C7E8F06|nr:response regulator [Kandeliimicrobium roseum]